MENEEYISQIYSEVANREAKTSKLAVTSMVFGILAPLCFAAVWIISFLSFNGIITAGRYIMTAFSYSAAWILGLILGMKSLEQISNSEEELAGRAFAVVGISISAVWMIVLIARFLLPALFYVNS